jgi:hypothetical protein
VRAHADHAAGQEPDSRGDRQREDFDTPLYARVAEQLLAGLTAAAVLDRVGEDERAQAARALGDEAFADEKNAMQIAQDSLNKIRAGRMEAALLLLQEEAGTAGEDRRRELIEQMSALMQELER